MNLNQYTVKSQEAIQKAQQIAMEFGNQSIEPQHLLEGIFQVDENISEFLMKSFYRSVSFEEKNMWKPIPIPFARRWYLYHDR